MFGKKKDRSGKKKPLWRRILKWTGISFLVLLIFIIAAPFLFEKKIFEYIKQEVNNNLNAKFECADYGLTLISSFPNFTLELKEVKLSGVDEFEGVDLIDVDNMVFTIDLYSVLFGDNIDIRKIGLENPNINVLVLENGKANYDIAKADTTATTEEPAEESKFAIKLREYYIKKGNIVYDDRAGDMYARLVNLNHSGEGDFTQDLFEFKTTTTADTIDYFMGGIPYMKNTKADITFNMDMDMPNMKFTFKDNLVKLNALELAFNGFVAMPGEDIDMDITFDSKQTAFSNLYSMVPAIYTADYSSIKFDGKTAFNGMVKGKMSASSMPAINLDLSVDNGSFRYPDLPKAATGIFVRCNVNSKGDPSMDDMVVDLSTFKMDLGGNKINAFLHLVNPITDPGIKAGLISKLDLATLKDVVPMAEGEEYSGTIESDVSINGRMSSIEKEEYDKFEAKGSILAKDLIYKSPDMGYSTALNIMDFRFTPQALELAQFDADVDKSKFMANGKMENYLAYFLKGETLKGEFNLSSPEIDLKPFMSSSSETDANAAAPAAEAAPAETAATAESYVFEVPRNIDFVMQTKIGKLIYPNYTDKPDIVLDNVNGQVTMREGVLLLDDLSCNTLEGRVVMNGDYDSRDVSSPTAKFKIDIANMDIKKSAETFNTIDKVAPIASKCTGKFSTSFVMDTKLTPMMEPDYNTLSGKGTLSTKKVFIEGFEPLNKLAAALKINKLAKQNIEDVNLSFEFKDGRLWVDPYDIKMNNYKASIGGSTGIDQTLDYKIDIAIPRSEFGGQANDVLNNLASQATNKTGIPVEIGELINVRAGITGTVTDPKITTDLKDKASDLKEDLKEAVKEKIEEKVEEVKEEVKAKVSEEAEKIMKEAEAKAAQIRAEAKKAADKVREESKVAADKLIAEAGNNPLKKVAAQKAADKLIKEGEEKAQKIEAEADAKSQKVLDEGRAQADKLK